MGLKDFKIGDDVRYIGTETHSLIGKIGVVIEIKRSSIDVKWTDHKNYGIYPYNAEKISLVPEELFVL